MPEGETKQAIGTCTEVVQKPGSDWVEFHIDVGSKYPVRLSTKLEALIEDAKAVGQDVATWTYKESQGNPNPNKPGTFYTNRYLSSVEVGGTLLQNATVSPTASVREYTPDLKDRMIVRQTALKAAAELYAPRAGLITDAQSDAALEVMKAAQRFETWVYRDIEEPPSKGGPELSEHDSSIPF